MKSRGELCVVGELEVETAEEGKLVDAEVVAGVVREFVTVNDRGLGPLTDVRRVVNDLNGTRVVFDFDPDGLDQRVCAKVLVRVEEEERGDVFPADETKGAVGARMDDGETGGLVGAKDDLSRRTGLVSDLIPSTSSGARKVVQGLPVLITPVRLRRGG